MDVRNAYENLRVVEKSIISSHKELTAAEKNFDIVRKRWEQGMAPQIEFLDAQNTYTQAELNAIIVNYDYFIKRAELEKAAAAFELNLNE